MSAAVRKPREGVLEREALLAFGLEARLVEAPARRERPRAPLRVLALQVLLDRTRLSQARQRLGEVARGFVGGGKDAHHPRALVARAQRLERGERRLEQPDAFGALAQLRLQLAHAREAVGFDPLVVGFAREREELAGHAEGDLRTRHRLVRLAHRLQAERLEALAAELARDAERAIEEPQRVFRFRLAAHRVAGGAVLLRLLDVAERGVVEIESGALVVADLAPQLERLVEELERRRVVAELDLDVADVGDHLGLP